VAIVVSVNEIRKRLETLGWTNLSATDVVDAIAKAGVSAASLVAYLDAVIASPAGCDDQQIAGCAAADANKLTNALKARGFEAV
jgi:L-ribulose-5-phosphate 3-epimerase UlaE